MKILYDRLRVQEKGSGIGAALDGAHVFYNGTVLQELAQDTIDMDDVPSMALPYPITFVEAELPIADEAGVMTYRAGQQAGILFRQFDFDPKRAGTLKFLRDDCRWFIEATLFLKMPEFRKVDNVCSCMIALDDQGVMIPMGFGEHFGLWYLRRNPEFYKTLEDYIAQSNFPVSLEEYDDFMSMILEGGLYTIGLLHCKNIGTEEQAPRASENHKFRKQHGFPMSRYKVLKITGKSKSAGSIIGSPTERKLAMHWCRAHFMHFGEDAPLFGKHVGAFFVPAHIKGNASRGIVAKDYDVKVNARETERSS